MPFEANSVWLALLQLPHCLLSPFGEISPEAEGSLWPDLHVFEEPLQTFEP